MNSSANFLVSGVMITEYVLIHHVFSPCGLGTINSRKPQSWKKACYEETEILDSRLCQTISQTGDLEQVP